MSGTIVGTINKEVKRSCPYKTYYTFPRERSDYFIINLSFPKLGMQGCFPVRQNTSKKWLIYCHSNGKFDDENPNWSHENEFPRRGDIYTGTHVASQIINNILSNTVL